MSCPTAEYVDGDADFPSDSFGFCCWLLYVQSTCPATPRVMATLRFALSYVTDEPLSVVQSRSRNDQPAGSASSAIENAPACSFSKAVVAVAAAPAFSVKFERPVPVVV